MLKHVNSGNFKKEILENDKVVLVDFYADWCGPCKMVAPILEKIGSERSDFDIAKINVDESQDLAYEYSVQAIPTMVIFKNGKVVNSITGFMTENQIVEMLSSYID